MARKGYLEIDEDYSITLPSQKDKGEEEYKRPRVKLPSSQRDKDDIFPSRREQRTRRSSRRRKPLPIKWIVIIFLVIVLYLFYNSIILFILDILRLNPFIYKFYLFAETEIGNSSLIGLFLVSVLGSIFFLILPSEAIFLYYLNSTDYFPILLVFLLIIGNLVGLIFNYIFGFLLGRRALQLVFKENYNIYEERIQRFGGFVLLIGNIIPGPIEVLTVFYGGFRFSFTRFVYLCFIGRLIKYGIILMLYIFFWEHIVVYYELFLDNYSVLEDLFSSDFEF